MPTGPQPPSRATGAPQIPGDYDMSALDQPAGRQLDPFNAAVTRAIPAGTPAVRYASQEVILPLPNGPMPGGVMPNGLMPGGPMPNIPMMPGGPMPGGPMPNGAMPNGAMPAPEVVPTPAPFEVPLEASGAPIPTEMAPADRLAWLSRMLWDGNTRDPNHDRGIAYERVQYAPYILDTVMPTNQYGIRFDAAYHWRAPDLGELLVAQPQSAGGTGLPVADKRLNYQDFDFVSEFGNSTVSAKTIIPLRLIDGTDNGDTAGLGDVEMDTKLVMLNGEYIKFAQFTGMHFNSGDSMKGLGTGHISIEPGMLASLKCSDETYLHAEMKFLFPIAANAEQKSNLLTWGLGLSHVLYDYDSFAVIPSVEAVFYTVYNGGFIEPGPVPVFVGNNWVTVPTLHYGVRMMTDRVRDLGLIEFGFSGGFSFGANVWYEDIFRVEVRVIF